MYLNNSLVFRRSIFDSSPGIDIHYQQLKGWIGIASIRSTMVRPDASHTVAQALIVVLQLVGSLLSSVDTFYMFRPTTRAMQNCQVRGRATMSAKTKKLRGFQTVRKWCTLVGAVAVIAASGLNIGFFLQERAVSMHRNIILVDVKTFATVNCLGNVFHYQQLKGWMGIASIRSTMVRPDASHTVAQLLTSHLRISRRVA